MSAKWTREGLLTVSRLVSNLRFHARLRWYNIKNRELDRFPWHRNAILPSLYPRQLPIFNTACQLSHVDDSGTELTRTMRAHTAWRLAMEPATLDRSTVDHQERRGRRNSMVVETWQGNAPIKDFYSQSHRSYHPRTHVPTPFTTCTHTIIRPLFPSPSAAIIHRQPYLLRREADAGPMRSWVFA